MIPTTRDFVSASTKALGDPDLQRALANVPGGFRTKRAKAFARLPEYEALRDAAVAIKDATLADLARHLETFEARVQDAGGVVHWCADAAEARETIVGLCRRAGARKIAKGKSMATEEIGLNDALTAAGMTPVETDLGEYIIQLRNEPPSHIIAPAIHLNKEHIADAFRAHHGDLDLGRDLSDHRALMDEARARLRHEFLAADVGITGANFLVAETGTAVIVTNEGNGDLSQTLPPVQIVVAGIDKIVATLDDAMTLLRLLPRAATGQDITVYTSFTTGPRRAGDIDGPEAFHVVLVDNGRTALLGGPMRDMLRCIRCAACMNHCPVYSAVGGHAYGWVYPGPMGAVLTPALIGVDRAGVLANASTFCGRCEDVCPVRIPLPKLMRLWRDEEHRRNLSGARQRGALALWSFVARRPRLYRLVSRIGVSVLGLFGRGRARHVPLAGGWTRGRDLPLPQGTTFFAQYRRAAGTSGDDPDGADMGAGA